MGKMEFTVIDLNKVCRTCKNESLEMESLYHSSHLESGKENPGLDQMLMACSSVQVDTEDELPKLICQSCRVQLTNAYLFKEQCEKTDLFLRDYLQNLNRVKVKEETETPDMEFSWDLIGEVNSTMSDKTRNRNGIDSIEDDPDIHLSEHREEDMDLIQVVNDIATYQCRNCSKLFYTSEGIRSHKRRHTDKAFKCKQCNKSYTKLNYLHQHELSHSKRKTHICKICNKSLTTLENLKRHRLTHPIEKSFPCTNCNRRFNCAEHLQTHSTCCNGTNVYVCDICNKSFLQEKSLELHRRIHANKARVLPTLKNIDNIEKHDIVADFEKETIQSDEKDLDATLETELLKNNNQENIDGITQINNEICAKEDLFEMSPEQTKIKEELLLEDANNGNVVNEHALETDNRNNSEIDNVVGTNNDSSTNIESIPEKGMTKPTRWYICHICQAKFLRTKHLAHHLTIHKAILIHKCDRCDKAFAKPECLAEHIQKDHIDKPYTCAICDKAYSRGEHLINHLKTHLNPIEVDIKCSICEKEFTRSDQLAEHIKLHLQQDKRHVCNDCGKAFNRLDSLKIHQRIHTGQKDSTKEHLCIYCGKEFSSSSNMLVHIRRHTGDRPYECSQCSKAFPRSHDLKCHERTHSEDKPYTCTLCGKAFKTSNTLLRHARVHTGERPYVCTVCNKAFTQSNDLAMHMRRHTGVRPYACGICPARFIQSAQLKAHRRSTGHSMETQSDLKGGHRVEPVVPLSDSVPIKGKRVQGIRSKRISTGLQPYQYNGIICDRKKNVSYTVSIR